MEGRMDDDRFKKQLDEWMPGGWKDGEMLKEARLERCKEASQKDG